ncbi:E3 ubiquitin-protein ligase MSL2-like [Tubulanus polymorphus]|uniref:E3 ubiquitin-protein ligase MSL2-like n=1 Tax=Tubulanus polymorphus TaxID=672921 RepID=UPI003DA24C52
MALNLYIVTCRLVMRAKSQNGSDLSEIHRYLPYLRQALSCCVCSNLIVIPTGPSNSSCLHYVCRDCRGGKMRLRPSCSWCKNHDEFVENHLLRIVAQCYKKLCEYLSSSPDLLDRLASFGRSEESGATTTDIGELIREGAALNDSFDNGTTSQPQLNLSQFETLRSSNASQSALAKTKSPSSSGGRGKSSRRFKFRKRLKEKRAAAERASKIDESANRLDGASDDSCGETNKVEFDEMTSHRLNNTRNSSTSDGHRSSSSSGAGGQLNHVGNRDAGLTPVESPAVVERKQVNDHVDEIIRSVTESAAKYGESIDRERTNHQQTRIHDNNRLDTGSVTEERFPALHSELNRRNSGEAVSTKQTFRLEHDPLEALSPEKISARVCIEHDYMKDSSTYYSVTMSSDTEPKLTIRRRPVTDVYPNKKPQLQIDGISLVSSSSPSAMTLNNDAYGGLSAKPRKIPRARKDKQQKKKGCRCGTATPTPGKLTCCGQRCPCYTSYKPCVDCSCRGCHNPRKFPSSQQQQQPVVSTVEPVTGGDEPERTNHQQTRVVNSVDEMEDVEISVV